MRLLGYALAFIVFLGFQNCANHQTAKVGENGSPTTANNESSSNPKVLGLYDPAEVANYTLLHSTDSGSGFELFVQANPLGDPVAHTKRYAFNFEVSCRGWKTLSSAELDAVKSAALTARVEKVAASQNMGCGGTFYPHRLRVGLVDLSDHSYVFSGNCNFGKQIILDGSTVLTALTNIESSINCTPVSN